MTKIASIHDTTNIESLIKKYLNSKEPVFVTLDLHPDEANEILEANTNNRTVRAYLVKRYTRLMNEGKWQLNAECIKIARDGQCLDGQHRLMAITQADNPVRVTVAFGLKPDTFKTIDTGQARTSGDIMHMAGYKNVNELSAAVRWMLTYQRAENLHFQAEICPEDILDGIKRWPALDSYIYPARELSHVLPGSFTVFFMYVTKTIDEEKSNDFFAKIASGAKLGKTSPILMLRELLMKYKAQALVLDKRYMAAYIINAWNAYYTGKKVKTIKWQPGQTFPLIEGVDRKKLFRKLSIK
jgi:hypothetical protein